MGAFDFLRTTDELAGWHGPPTSTIDWCELNYVYSWYIAELVNTLTNLPVIVLGLYCAWATYRAGAPKRYSLVHLGLAGIGIGSFGFHGTLKWEWQLMDELPMIYVASYAAYLVLDTLPGFKPRFGVAGPLVVAAWCVFVTVSYLCLPNPVYHQVAFALLMISSCLRSAYLIYLLPPANRRKLNRTLWFGIGVFALGFAVWNADNYFCERLRAARAALQARGLGALGHFTEGHGWWHLLTGYGAQQIFTACIELCLCHKTGPEEWSYDDTALVPIVRRAKPARDRDTEKYENGANGNANGNGYGYGSAVDGGSATRRQASA